MAQLLDCPPELMEMIAYNLDASSLCAFRHTCKGLEKSSFRPFGSLFTRLRHCLTIHSLDVLYYITAHPSFGPFVRSILINTYIVEGPLEDFIVSPRTYADWALWVRLSQQSRDSHLLTADPFKGLLRRRLAHILHNLAGYQKPLEIGVYQNPGEGCGAFWPWQDKYVMGHAFNCVDVYPEIIQSVINEGFDSQCNIEAVHLQLPRRREYTRFPVREAVSRFSDPDTGMIKPGINFTLEYERAELRYPHLLIHKHADMSLLLQNRQITFPKSALSCYDPGDGAFGLTFPCRRLELRHSRQYWAQVKYFLRRSGLRSLALHDVTFESVSVPQFIHCLLGLKLDMLSMEIVSCTPTALLPPPPQTLRHDKVAGQGGERHAWTGRGEVEAGLEALLMEVIANEAAELEAATDEAEDPA